jgi:hypothetical protein
MKAPLESMRIKPSASITEAMEIIQKGGCRGAFVCDEHGVLLGLVMDADIRRAILKHGKLDISVRTIMKTTPFTIDAPLPAESRKENYAASGKLLAPVINASRQVVDYLYLATSPGTRWPPAGQSRRVPPAQHPGGGRCCGYIRSPTPRASAHGLQGPRIRSHAL